MGFLKLGWESFVILPVAAFIAFPPVFVLLVLVLKSDPRLGFGAGGGSDGGDADGGSGGGGGGDGGGGE